MRVKLFSQGVTAPIQSLENDMDGFLESQRPHVAYVSVTSSDVEGSIQSGTKSRIIGPSNRRCRNWRNRSKSPAAREI